MTTAPERSSSSANVPAGPTIVIPKKETKGPKITYIWMPDAKGNLVKADASVVKKSFAKKKAVKSDQPIIQTLADAIAKEGDAWIALYTEDLAASNFSAPTTTPNVTFTVADDPAGGKILYANLANTANFDPVALRITSYDVEWYVGSTTSTPLANSADIESVKAGGNLFSLSQAVAGGLYFFRIKAINSVGTSPWSTFFQAIIAS
jgi:hypothetical protein